ncbi:MAG: acyl-CoA dehydrogenase family protein [Rhizobiales bacterium]|nr:acyl-CoA dehydrogenase family protein [Hyphomicrobiales bacterium]
MDRDRQSSAKPKMEEIIASASSFIPLLRQNARRTEEERRPPSDMMQQLGRAGLLKLCRPARFGGYEYEPSALLRLGFELGQGCGSTAWCASIANCNSWFLSYWPLQAQSDVWGENPDALVAGTVIPTGKCEAVEGGYKISGRWPFASNCENSNWHFVSAMLPDNQGTGWFLAPARDFDIDQASWRVSGLQGTGSKTVYADNPFFVPTHRVIRFDDIADGSVPGAAIDDCLLPRFVFSTFGACALVGPLLGMAQGALKWFVEQMAAKQRATMRQGVSLNAAQNPFVQERAGAASAEIDAGMTFVLSEIERLETILRSGTLLSVEQRMSARRAIGFAAKQAVTAVDILMAGAGASSMDVEVPMQRHWRDIHAAAGHISLDTRSISMLVGQTLFGMTPMGPY